MRLIGVLSSEGTGDEGASRHVVGPRFAAFFGKYDGFLAGLSFQIAAIFRALAGFKFKELTALVRGQKLDGSQAM